MESTDPRHQVDGPRTVQVWHGHVTADSTDVPSTLLRSRAKWSCCTWKVVASSQFINNGDARMYSPLVLFYHRDRLAVWPVNCQTSSATHRYRLTVSVASLKHSCLQTGSSVRSALDIFLFMRYKSLRLLTYLLNWLRGAVVERWSLTGKLSLSCARPAADGWPPFRWLNRPL